MAIELDLIDEKTPKIAETLRGLRFLDSGDPLVWQLKFPRHSVLREF